VETNSSLQRRSPEYNDAVINSTCFTGRRYLSVIGKRRVGHIALKSESPQAFFSCAATQLKAQLRSLRFKILDATFNRNFYHRIWYSETRLHQP
jgi:hypothetical protein